MAMTQMPGWRNTHFWSSFVGFWSRVLSGSPASSCTVGSPLLSGVSEMNTRATMVPMTPAAAAAMKPHCQPAQATMKPVAIIVTALPKDGVELKMLYIVPRLFSGNQRERLMVPGGEPIDWTQPFTPQRMAKHSSVTIEPMPSGPCSRPRMPSTTLMTAEIPRPQAMNRRMLQ